MNSGDRPPIHVLHVVPGLSPAGMEIALSRVVCGLSGGDMRHSIACLTGEAVIRDQFPPSAEIHCLRSVPNDPLLPWRLWRLLRHVRPTVIHARNWGAWPDVAVARLATWPRIPLIFSFHGLTEYQQIPLRRRLASRVLLRLTTRLFTVTEPTKRMLVEGLGWPAQRVQVIPNGVDTDRFAPRPDCRPPSGRLVVGTVGRLSPVKNHALLIRACADLLARRVNLGVRIAGEGPEQENLAGLAQSLGIPDRVRLLGHVEDVPAFLRDLDVFVLPSAAEAHPNALLEAMACGVACVATDVGGVGEAFDGGRVGYVIKPGDQPGLVQAIAELAKDPTLMQRRGNAARDRACTQYSLQPMLRAYDALYRETSLARGQVGDRRGVGPAEAPEAVRGDLEEKKRA